MEEMDRFIRRSNAKSSPGKDGIDYSMIKFLPERRIFKIEILKLFNYAFNNSYMFQDWREVITIFIDKPGKQKVRPITMSSCLLKLMERIINDKLTWWIENKDILDEGQNGFRKGSSCQGNWPLELKRRKGFLPRKELSRCFWTSRRHMIMLLAQFSLVSYSRLDVLRRFATLCRYSRENEELITSGMVIVQCQEVYLEDSPKEES